ncbi:MAG TPA: hypothetical protein VML75_17055, partial [Kofleriaceae bacterium]|nr:hypothetical protein [Kofleriaceae bacterium]
MVDGGPFRWAKSSDPGARDVIALAASCDGEALAAAVLELDERQPDRRRHSVLLAGFDAVGTRCGLAQMGDARAYLFRPAPMKPALPTPLAPRFCPEVVREDGSGMVCLTWDHSTACDLVEMELLDRDEGRRRARRRVLTRGVGAEPPTRPDVLHVDLVPGDRLLLCSAEVWLALDDPAIAEVLASATDVDAACRALAGRADSDRRALMVIEHTGAAAARGEGPSRELLRFGRDLT